MANQKLTQGCRVFLVEEMAPFAIRVRIVEQIYGGGWEDLPGPEKDSPCT